MTTTPARRVILELPAHVNFVHQLRGAADLVFQHELAEDEHIAGRGSAWAENLRRVADQIEAQLPKPRIAEPTFGAVVRAGVKEHDVRLRWVRVNVDTLSQAHWICEDPDERQRSWDDLVDPEVVRS